MLTFTENGQAMVKSYLWQHFFEGAMGFAKTLHALGVKEGSRICFMGHNSPEHFMALAGTILANCIFTEVYPTNGPAACAAQVTHSNAVVIVCDS